MIEARLAWREIRNNGRFAALFALNLALGLLGFAVLDSFKLALDKGMADRSRVLLSADLAVSARRELAPDEEEALHAALPAGSQEGRLVEMYSMVAAGNSSRMVELDAIDETYPFYGNLELRDAGKIRGSTAKTILESDTAWVQPELGTQLKIAKGDELKLGDLPLRVGDFVVEDTSEVWRGFSIATRVYVGIRQLARTGLLRKGSTATRSRLIRLPEGADAEQVARRVDQALKDPGIQVRTFRKASEEVSKPLRYLDDYLGLVALVALFLACIGSGYLFRSFLSRRTREISILACLGVSNRVARRIYVLQLAMLGFLAAAGTCALCALLLAPMSWVIAPYLPFPVALHLEARTAAITLLMGGLGSVLICLPLILKISELKPAMLFQESADPSMSFSPKQLGGALPGVAVFAGLSVWQAHSFKMGGLFLGSFLGSCVILAGTGTALLSLLPRLEAVSGFRLRMAARNLSRARLSSVSCFLAIGIGSLLLNLIPTIQACLDAELAQPGDGSRPSLFLYDIQPEQAAPLQAYLQSQGIAPLSLSPTVRARLSNVNGKPFEKTVSQTEFTTREQEQEARSRNRGFNLSYPGELSKAEPAVEGHDFSGRFDPASGAPAEVSLERRFADRLGLRIGDLLDFDVQGIPVAGKVIGLRKVMWASFRPSFLVLFQPGVLEDAPKTFLATLPPMSPERRISLQDGIVSRFPNISMVNVTELADKIVAIFGQMSWALRTMAGLSLFAGLIVLYSIASHQAASRAQEGNLLKVLGSGSRDIRRISQLEFALLGFCAAFIGVVLSYGVSSLMIRFLFEVDQVFTWRTELVSLAAITALSAGTATVASRKAFAQKAVSLLHAETVSST